MARFDDHFLDEIRARVPLSEVIGRYVQWHKKSRPARGDYWACCPIHGEKSPSFHVMDNRGRYHCFGCGAGGDHFRFLMEHDGVAFPRAVEEVAGMAGLEVPGKREWTAEEKREYARRAADREKRKAEQAAQAEQERADRVMTAGSIWKQTVPLAGTPGARYFEWRGLPVPDDENIRFHPGLDRMPDRPTGDRHPAVVCRVQDVDGKGCAVWRIYVEPNGEGKSRAFENPKLGFGPAAGGAIRIGGIADTIGVAEGVETARAVTALGAPYPVWSLMSTSGMIGFKIPEGVKRIVIYPDRDASKVRFKSRRDGTEFIAGSPGLEAAAALIAAYPGFPISIADGPAEKDYLELWQAMGGLPVR